MNPHYRPLFIAMDAYEKTEYRCFVSECFLTPAETEWVICVRPTTENVRSLDRHACVYLHLSSDEVREIYDQGALTATVIRTIDNALRPVSYKKE
jgi:hypothetical protein